MKQGITRAALLAALLAALVATATGTASARPAQTGAAATAKVTVRVVNAGSSDFTTGDILKFVELMKRNGIDASYQIIPDAAAVLRSVVAGQSELAIASLPTAINAIINGDANIKIIGANNQATDYVLVAQRGITLRNLAGKTLAIDTPGSAGHLISKIALEKAGVDTSQIRFVSIGGSSARTTAVLAGRVDVAPIRSSLAIRALENPNIVELLNAGKTIGPYLQSGLIANDNFLKNKALAQKVVNAFIDAQRWAMSNKYRYIQLMQDNKSIDGLTGPQLEKEWDFLKALKFWGVNGGICAANVARFTQLNWTIGSLPKPLPARSVWLNDTFVKAYLKKRKQKPTTC